MQHVMFQDQRCLGSGEEDFKGFYNLRAWRPSWSGDQYKSMSSVPKGAQHIIWALICIAVLEKNLFENNGHIHV